MHSLYLLIPLAVILVGLAVWALFWAVRSGQYDDLNTEGRRILFDEQNRPAEGVIHTEKLHKPEADSRDA
jgi:cbb3-type cytochrome oxidase maturation protein